VPAPRLALAAISLKIYIDPGSRRRSRAGPFSLLELAMEWKIIAGNFLYAVLGVVLMYLSYRTIDRLTPEVDFAAELKKGNVAAAIFIASIFVGIALIIGGALN
jgi:hypothetical protein